MFYSISQPFYTKQQMKWTPLVHIATDCVHAVAGTLVHAAVDLITQAECG